MTQPFRLAITMGDPAGIGPEIIVKAVRLMREERQGATFELAVLGSAAALDQAARALDFDLHGDEGRGLQVIDVGPVDAEVVVGEVSAAGGEWAYRAVVRAVQMCQAGEMDGIVTAPLSKEALHLAGHAFPGHTELLAHLTGMRDSVMMLAHGNMRVSHVSTHCALAEVPSRVTPQRLSRVLDPPIVRTSVDHGTAFDIAGQGVANADSLVDAARCAIQLIRGRRAAAKETA